MGHGLNAPTMATVAVGSYRHARRADIGPSEIYAFMDHQVMRQLAGPTALPVGFGGEEPRSASRCSNTATGCHALKRQRGGRISDGATLFPIEWRGGTADHLALLE
ncbi:hypothetical protein [Streptomyces sp. NPDC048710]|uniref:hypothetical protein n=1 Tax=Streptomyces sp. NPDC048710 TaxID=3365586 RepID=UPI00371B5068